MNKPPERVWIAHINDDTPNGEDIVFSRELDDPLGRIVWQAEYIRADLVPETLNKEAK